MYPLGTYFLAWRPYALASNNNGPMGSKPRPDHVQKTMILTEIIGQIMLAALSSSFSVQKFSSTNIYVITALVSETWNGHKIIQVLKEQDTERSSQGWMEDWRWAERLSSGIPLLMVTSWRGEVLIA